MVDSHEQYAYRFAGQQVSTVKRALPCGDYGLVVDGRLVASVERKSLTDLVASLTSGKLRYALAELAALPRAAVVVEDRYSQVFKLERVRPALVADGLAELQIRWPSVPIVFCETRPLAEEWTYRFLAAAHAWADTETASPSGSHHWPQQPPRPSSPRRRTHPNPPPPKSGPGHAPPDLPSPTAASSAPRSGPPGAQRTAAEDARQNGRLRGLLAGSCRHAEQPDLHVTAPEPRPGERAVPNGGSCACSPEVPHH